MPYTIIGDIQKLELLTNKATMDNPCFILTLDNQVLIGDDIVLLNGYNKEAIVQLPESMRPVKPVVLPVYYKTTNSATSSSTASNITIDTDGRVFHNSSLTIQEYSS